MNPFIRPEFKSWVSRLSEEGACIACVVKYTNGRVVTCGDSQWGIETFREDFNSKKRASREWVPKNGNMKLLDRPLMEIYKNTSMMKSGAASLIRSFIGPKTPFGTGECILWDHQVQVENLKYSKDDLVKVWDSPIISLQDIIAWSNFKVKTFGNKLPDEAFKINMVWRVFCVMVIEVVYDVLKLNVDLPSGSEMPVVNHPELKKVKDTGSLVIVPETENLREKCSDKKVLHGYFKDLSSGCDKNLTVQILQILPSKTSLDVRLNDGENWVQCTLDQKYSEQVEMEKLQPLDIIKVVEYSGSFSDGNFHVKDLCRPRSLQLKNKKFIGNPVPLDFLRQVQSCGVKRNILPRAPRVDELFDDISFEG